MMNTYTNRRRDAAPSPRLPLALARGPEWRDKFVDLLVVIVEYTLPWKSKGTDYTCSIKVADHSYQAPAMTVNFFSGSLAKLPHVVKVGDVVYLSCFKIKIYKDEAYAVFEKNLSSFALFDGRLGEDEIAYEVSSEFGRHGFENDIVLLRQWLSNFELDAGRSESELSLKEIRKDKYFDLICKIVYSHEVSSQRMLFAWDGTDTPPLTIQRKIGDEQNNPLPLHVESLSLPTDILSKFPKVGSVLRIEVKQNCNYYWSYLLDGGQWVRLRTIKCEEHSDSGMWKGVVSTSSRIHILSNEGGLAARCLRNYDERISLQSYMPSLSFPGLSHILVTSHKDVPCVTLINLVTHAKVASYHKCVVRVVAMSPSLAQDFLLPPSIRLTIEDPTARMHVFLCHEDRERFFGGYPGSEMFAEKRNKVLGIRTKENGEEDENFQRNPPWVLCCLTSNRVHNMCKSDDYKIFATEPV